MTPRREAETRGCGNCVDQSFTDRQLHRLLLPSALNPRRILLSINRSGCRMLHRAVIIDKCSTSLARMMDLAEKFDYRLHFFCQRDRSFIGWWIIFASLGNILRAINFFISSERVWIFKIALLSVQCVPEFLHRFKETEILESQIIILLSRILFHKVLLIFMLGGKLTFLNNSFKESLNFNKIFLWESSTFHVRNFHYPTSH